MDINPLINNQLLLPVNRLMESALNLKVGQQVEVKAVSANTLAAKNTFTLSLVNQVIAVQSNQPITLSPNQTLKIQLTQIAPVIAFKIINALPELKTPTTNLRLTLIATDESILKDTAAIVETKLYKPLDVKIVSLIGNKIQLQIIASATPALITLERTQLNNLPADLKVGQYLKLEIIKTGTIPEFKIIPADNAITEAKTAYFMKQFLPRHQASPIFLNQLIKNLPQLLNNERIPEALKDLAVKIVQNLPDQEQLISSSGLKQAVTDSGVFFEAKLAALINNDSVPVSLQSIAAEIVQKLLPKASDIKSKQLSETEVVKRSEIPIDFQVGTTHALATEDFKANLLKFIQALKHELGSPNEQQHNQTDFDLIKSLQNKTENTVAKITLDQLMSLPKDDSPKQLWIVDLPFMDRQQAETVKIEIQQDKANKKQSSSNDWSVNITITPPELGTIHCMVSFRAGLINTFFNSRDTQTTGLIKRNLGALKNQLEASGLTTGHMDAHDSTEKIPVFQQLAKKLFDDQA